MIWMNERTNEKFYNNMDFSENGLVWLVLCFFIYFCVRKEGTKYMYFQNTVGSFFIGWFLCSGSIYRGLQNNGVEDDTYMHTHNSMKIG